MFIHTSKTIQAGLGETPEPLDAVDMGIASDEFILSVIDPQVLVITDINQAIVTPPTVRIDDAIECDTTADNPLQRKLSAIRDDFCVNVTIGFEHAEDGRLTEGTTPSLALDNACTKVGIVHLDLTREWRLGLAVFSNAFTDASQITVDGVAVEARQGSDLGGVQI